MARKRSFHRDGRGFGIAHFTDHDDVRVLSEHRAESGGKGHASTLVHAALVDARKLIFNRIFDSDDVVVACIEAV